MLESNVRWRIDKDEVSSIFTRMRCNLMGKTYGVLSGSVLIVGCASVRSDGCVSFVGYTLLTATTLALHPQVEWRCQ